MGAIIHTLGWEALSEALAATGTYGSIAAAVDAGAVAIEGSSAVGGFTVITGGAAAEVIDLTATALEVAESAELAATASEVGTASVTLLETTGGFKLGAMATMSLPEVAAVAAPLAGVAIGTGLYASNPSLWTKISSTLLPFCYAENKIQAFVDFVQDPLTSEYSPVMLIATEIIDALKNLFEKEEVKVNTACEWSSSYGSVTGAQVSQSFTDPNLPDYPFETDQVAYAVGVIVGGGQQVYFSNAIRWTSDFAGGTHRGCAKGWNYGLTSDPFFDLIGVTWVDMTLEEFRRIISNSTEEIIEPTAGVSAPTVPVEPIVWPDLPIIIIPDPLGPDYQPIPVTPVTPALPEPEPIPLLPEHVPDPTPEKPEEWPEEEPWPTVIPDPFIEPDPSTEPDPNVPYIPWPLPEKKPDENDPEPSYWPQYPPEWPDPWPDYPTEWPGEWPDDVPWPDSPDEWPEEVPWPDPDSPPEWWPGDVPWPDSPDEWPEEVPWPSAPTWPTSPEEWPDDVPWPDPEPEELPRWWPDGEPWPDSPDDWPEEVPWPLSPPWPFPWPDDRPYPYPYPYPNPSPDPYPDPREIPDPEKRIDPHIDPWPYRIPDPRQDPPIDPYSDPSQPDPVPDPRPDPDPDPDPGPPSDGRIDPAPPPIIPLPFSSTTGLISVYHPSQQELLAFCNWLWVTWQDATIDKIWNNPFDGVITLFELYCTPTDVGTKTIRSGFLDSQISSPIISRYTEINCGSIGVPEYYGDYLDYAPYSKCHIYLPFIGIVELNVDDIVGHGVNVTYRIDEYNGSCIAMITVAKSTTVNGTEVEYSNIMYQFSGNCAVDLPIAGGSQAAIKAGMLEAAAWGLGSVISGVITGGSGGLGVGASIGNNLAQGAASAVHSVVSAKSSVQHSGSFGSSFGALGNKKPFIIVTRPKQIQVPNYNVLYGYPSHKMVVIGNCTGYLRCREVHVISPTASDEEKAQIEQLLKLGVYITE